MGNHGQRDLREVTPHATFAVSVFAYGANCLWSSSRTIRRGFIANQASMIFSHIGCEASSIIRMAKLNCPLFLSLPLKIIGIASRQRATENGTVLLDQLDKPTALLRPKFLVALRWENITCCKTSQKQVIRCLVSLRNASAMRVDCQLRKPVGQALAANNFSLSRSSSLHIHDVVCSLQTSCFELLRYGLGEHSHSVVSMCGQNNLLLAQVDLIVANIRQFSSQGCLSGSRRSLNFCKSARSADKHMLNCFLMRRKQLYILQRSNVSITLDRKREGSNEIVGEAYRRLQHAAGSSPFRKTTYRVRLAIGKL